MEDSGQWRLDSDLKQVLILVGEIKNNQKVNIERYQQIEKRLASMETKINYAIGVAAAIIFFFQAGWTYFTKMGKS